jgi:hypothetical protein
VLAPPVSQVLRQVREDQCEKTWIWYEVSPSPMALIVAAEGGARLADAEQCKLAAHIVFRGCNLVQSCALNGTFVSDCESLRGRSSRAIGVPVTASHRWLLRTTPECQGGMALTRPNDVVAR